MYAPDRSLIAPAGGVGPEPPPDTPPIDDTTDLTTDWTTELIIVAHCKKTLRTVLRVGVPCWVGGPARLRFRSGLQSPRIDARNQRVHALCHCTVIHDQLVPFENHGVAIQNRGIVDQRGRDHVLRRAINHRFSRQVGWGVRWPRGFAQIASAATQETECNQRPSGVCERSHKAPWIASALPVQMTPVRP